MTTVLNAALPIFSLILIGYVFAKRRVMGRAATDSLNKFVVFLALPALLFQGMAGVTWQEMDHPGFFVSFGGGMVVCFILAYALARRQRQRLADAGIEALAACYGNTGYMGIPLCLATFGPASLPAVVIGTLLTTCVPFGVAIAMVEIDLRPGASLRRTLWLVGRSLVSNPLLVAPLLGLLVAATEIPLPAPILRLTTLLGGAASPCALVTIGLFLAQQNSANWLGAVWRIVTIKLLLQPAITGALALLAFDMPALWSRTALLLSALPIGTGPFMVAALYRRNGAATSQAILVSTILSVVTISLLIAWFAPA
jgi:malonate transporter